MADFKSHMFRHLRSTRQWLAKAEESFDKDSHIRGELDLILAQAELQHARESNCSHNGRFKFPLITQVLSLAIAASVFAVGFGTFWWLEHRGPAVPIPLAVQEAKNGPVNVVPVEKLAVQAPIKEAPTVLPAVEASVQTPPVARVEDRQDKNQRSLQTEKENLLSPDEMQKVIRAAGKSLRGQ